MNQKEVFAKIGGIIKELNDQYAYLEAEPANINSLELELFVSNARFLTNHIEILAKLNAQASYNQPASAAPEPKQEPKHTEPTAGQARPEIHEKQPEEVTPADLPHQPVPHVDLGEAGANDSYSYIRQEPETIRHELVLDESINWEDGDEDLEEENEPPKIAHNKMTPAKAIDSPQPVTTKTDDVPQPVAAKADPVEEKTKPATPAKSNEDMLTINQKMSSQMAGKANPVPAPDTPVTDIKQAITLNDKLLFIKDLFNGYSLAYSEAIEILNRFNTFEEASAFLNKNYAVKNNWESKPETAEKFYTLLRRRYA